MTTSDIKGNDNKITALYCRLSVDDADKQSDEESNSIKNQKQILQDYCKKNGYHNTRFFVDDGISGTTFDRPGFKEMEALAEAGKVGTIIVKDLSRFGREQTETARVFVALRYVRQGGADDRAAEVEEQTAASMLELLGYKK